MSFVHTKCHLCRDDAQEPHPECPIHSVTPTSPERERVAGKQDLLDDPHRNRGTVHMSKGRYVCTYCSQDHHDGCVNIACPVGFHNVKSRSPKDLEDEDHQDPLETAKTESYELGCLSTLERFPKRLTTLAGEAFAAGKDDKAHLLRDLAKTIEKEGAEARLRWMEKYHPERLKER